MKKTIFTYFQPASVAVIVAFWYFAPQAWIKSPWSIVVASSLTLLMIQGLEFINERHAGWRINKREFFTDLFYVVLGFTAIAKLTDILAEDSIKAAKAALHLDTPWITHLPFVVQVAMVIVLIEFGQYWMHRAMHNSVLWLTHAPHHQSPS